MTLAADRTRLLNALYLKYGKKQGFRQRFLYWRKKYSWVIIVGGANLLKRLLDAFISISSLILCFPLMVLIGSLIKLSDGGPVFYISNRVGKWGKEFQFIKFRTMIINSEHMKMSLLDQNEFPEDITFKMKQDPRITRLGKFLRKTSLDELPQ